MIGVAAAVSGLALSACDSDGLSPAELNEAAKQRVTSALQLKPDATLFSSTFVGRSEEDPVLCGRVEGERADGMKLQPRRFIAATDPAEWVQFELPAEANHSQYQFTKDWAHLCAGGNEV